MGLKEYIVSVSNRTDKIIKVSAEVGEISSISPFDHLGLFMESNLVITKKELKRLLVYFPKTGIFKWRVAFSRKIRAGSMAGSINNHGYLGVIIRGTRYAAHRLAWLYTYGKWPKNCIDHINHDRADNRICNLRDVTMSENMRNQKGQRGNFAGVTWDKASKSWYAKIQVDGKAKYLGSFRTKSDAIAARKKANIKYRYHPNHGRILPDPPTEKGKT